MITALHLTNLSLVAMVTTAAAWDVRARRVPNWLVASGLAIALLAQCLEHGVLTGSWTWLLGAATGLGLFLGLYLLGGMGAGDVKLMGAVGAFMAPAGVLHVAIVSFMVGGALALVMMLIRGNAMRAFSSVSALLLSLPFVGTSGTKVAAAGRDKTDKTTQLPYAVAIAIGTLLVMWGVL